MTYNYGNYRLYPAYPGQVPQYPYAGQYDQVRQYTQAPQFPQAYGYQQQIPQEHYQQLPYQQQFQPQDLADGFQEDAIDWSGKSKNFIIGIIRVQEFLPVKMAQVTDELISEDSYLSKWHWTWAYPANFIANMVAFALSPVIAVITLAASAVFAVIGLVTDNKSAYEAAKISALYGVKANFIFAGVNFVRAFYPPFDPQI